MTLPNVVGSFTENLTPGTNGPFAMPGSASAWATVELDVDRTAKPNGLNSLTSATVATIIFEFSTDSGATWAWAAVFNLFGGSEPLSARLGGGIQTTDQVRFSRLGLPYGAGTQWRLSVSLAGGANAKVPVTISWE
jgi:hypothetical protein